MSDHLLDARETSETVEISSTQVLNDTLTVFKHLNILLTGALDGISGMIRNLEALGIGGANGANGAKCVTEQQSGFFAEHEHDIHALMASDGIAKYGETDAA